MKIIKQNLKFHHTFSIILFIIIFLLNIHTVLAVTCSVIPLTFDPACHDEIGSSETITLGNRNPFSTLKWLVYYTSSFLGFLFLCLIIYAGVLWMTARGNEEQITKAQTVLKRSLIGLIIVISSVSIAYLIYWVISQAGAQNLL